MKRKIFIILGIFVLFVPLGLVTKYSAWGEWKDEYYIKVLGYLPKGMSKMSGIKPLLPDYSLKGGNEILWYYISAILGIFVIFLIMYILLKIGGKNAS